jgi:proline dehydrogenase
VWSEKEETDLCYNECTALLLDQLVLPSGLNTSPGIGILFGTHNKDSCDIVMNGLVKRGLASEDTSKDSVLKVPQWVSGQVQLGQLLGMADDLTNYVSCRLDCEDAPMVLKCVPYGKLEDVSAQLFGIHQN